MTLPLPVTRISSPHAWGLSMKQVASLLLFSLVLTFPMFADDDNKDHHHHEDLTETQLGTVHFPISCAEAVQKPFARGVALLHSFWYEEAEKEFLDIAKDDPNCAMAHWGVAMSLWHQLWNQPDAKVIARGVSEANQRAKYYRLTAAGRAQLSRERDRWSQLVDAIGRIMNLAPASKE